MKSVFALLSINLAFPGLDTILVYEKNTLP